MPNPYFKFKKFTVYHDSCAMKVGTDGVLLAVWTDINTDKASNVLDVGTGSGLISLMLAQRDVLANIDAIDPDKGAVEQTKYNALNSPFSERIRCYHTSLQDYCGHNKMKYDLIISNPPYFIESLKSYDSQRNLARHTDSLSVEDLIKGTTFLLKETGILSVIYPYDMKNRILEIAAEHGMFPKRITNVHPTPKSEAKRVLIELSKIESEIEESNLVIEERRHVYSSEFIFMAKEFYLNL